MAEHPEAQQPTHDDDDDTDQRRHLLSLLESLRTSSVHVQSKYQYLPFDPNSPSLKTLVDSSQSTSTALLLSRHPDLTPLSLLLSRLKALLAALKSRLHSYSLPSFVYRRLLEYQIYTASASIELEIRAWFDRDAVQTLLRAMLQRGSAHEAEKVGALVQFERRVSAGFDKTLQEMILKERVLGVLEDALCGDVDDDSCTLRVREDCALAIAALARFNRSVFVGLLLMGPSVRAIVRMGTAGSLHVLCLLLRLIKGHLVDELEINGEIPRVLSMLNSESYCVQEMAMDCVLEIGYFGRKEVIDVMIEFGLIEKLVSLERVDVGGVESLGRDGEMEEEEEERRLSSRPFSGCILRFAVQVEVGEGLEKAEKKEVKMEILRRAREACVSEAEAAAIVAEVLWGSSP